MAPQEYSLRLQKGIKGGFAPPIPDHIYTLTKASAKSDLLIASAKREPGQPSLQDLLPKNVPHTDDNEKLVEELHGILRELPMENPPGSEDIYGLDTSIAWGSEDLEWCNGGPEGCGGGKSSIQATAEQKEKFKRAVDIVQQLVA
ncbi:hypothetical protein AN958_03338 [Leucoagaricus sp. SymC.cos]|nr:hypothetical protein AN958_03338 [Leucoagaricus sp. SymC.cos]